MRGRSNLEILVLSVNTLGLAVYLLWLMFKSHRIYYTQDGVLYLLPCIPFLFVYVFLLYRRKPSANLNG